MKKTAIHITGKQATQLLRMARRKVQVVAEPEPDHALTDSDVGVTNLDDLYAGDLFSALNIGASNPLEVLVPSDSSRCWASPAKSHLRTKILSVDLPKGSFLKLSSAPGDEAILWSKDTEIYIEAPELAIIRCARIQARMALDKEYDDLKAFLRTLEFIDECCGSYARDPFSPRFGEVHYDKPRELSRFTDPAHVKSYLQKASGLDGLRFARKVARYAIDESGSPMETYVNHALTLPPRYAGLSLRQPLANKQLVMSDAQWEQIKHDSLRPDFQWPDYNVLAEYLGEKDHASKSARKEDKNRMQDYTITPYDAFPLMFDDVKNASALNKTALMLARAFERHGSVRQVARLKKLMRTEDFAAQQRILVGTLLPPVSDQNV